MSRNILYIGKYWISRNILDILEYIGYLGIYWISRNILYIGKYWISRNILDI